MRSTLSLLQAEQTQFPQLFLIRQNMSYEEQQKCVRAPSSTVTEVCCQGEVMYQPLFCIAFLWKKICLFGLDGSSSRNQAETSALTFTGCLTPGTNLWLNFCQSLCEQVRVPSMPFDISYQLSCLMGAITPFLVFLCQRVGRCSSKRHSFLLFVWMPTETSWTALNLL